MYARLCRLQDLQPEQPVSVPIGDLAVLVVILDGTVHAIDDRCPHNGVSLAEGVLRDGCITCPGHFWRFSVRDGSKQADQRIQVATYRCWVDDGWVVADLPDPSQPRTMRQILLEHARIPKEVRSHG